MVGILVVFVLLIGFNIWRARRMPRDNSRIADQTLEMLKLQQEIIPGKNARPRRWTGSLNGSKT